MWLNKLRRGKTTVYGQDKERMITVSNPKFQEEVDSQVLGPVRTVRPERKTQLDKEPQEQEAREAAVQASAQGEPSRPASGQGKAAARALASEKPARPLASEKPAPQPETEDEGKDQEEGIPVSAMTMEERLEAHRKRRRQEEQKWLSRGLKNQWDGSEEHLLRWLEEIKPVSPEAKQKAWERWDSLCKPLRSFGKLEEIVVQVSAVQKTLKPYIDRPAVLIFGADNGVVEEGVSQSGPEVTAQVMENMANGISAISILAREIGAELYPVNIGMLTPSNNDRIIHVPVRQGTGNIAKGPAMDRMEAVQAIETGIRTVEKIARKGKNLLIAGEMGIGNTTTSSAMAAVFLGCSPQEVTGRGAGLSTEGLRRKVSAVERAIRVNKPDKEDVLDVLSKVGGLDIAGMAGCFLGCGLYGIPALIDGFISAVAALCAVKLCPACKDYLIASHCSSEPGEERILKELGLSPVLYAGMHMGEGTGAASLYPLLRNTFTVYRMLPTFAVGKVEAYEHLE